MWCWKTKKPLIDYSHLENNLKNRSTEEIDLSQLNFFRDGSYLYGTNDFTVTQLFRAGIFGSL